MQHAWNLRNPYKILVGKSEGKRPRRRPMFKWKNNIKNDLWEVVDWMRVAQDRDQWRSLMNTLMKLRVPYKAGNFLNS
jgi:hypothetical protein